MTVPFPHDPELPQLQRMLDENEMKRILSGELGIDVLGCKPKYVRYKPNTSCIVQYDLRFSCDEAEPITQTAHIKVFADHRAEAKATGSRAERLEKRLESLQPNVPKIMYLEELDGALQIYPADLDLRGLARVADTQGARRELRRALKLPRNPKLSGDPELIRYKPGRKALLRYMAKSVSDLPLYGKVFESQSVTQMKAITDTLIAGGLPTARVLGLVEEHNFIVQETVPGVALNEIRHLPDYVQWIQPLAETLWQLHQIEMPTLPAHDLAAEVRTLREVHQQLSILLPHLVPRLDHLLQKIEHLLTDVEDILATSHGDFYDDQALVGEDGLSLIDLEAMRRAHPLIDAGNMLAHLTAAAQKPDDHVTIAHAAFLQETMNHSGASEATVRLFEAAGLLKLAPGPFRRLEDEWYLGVERFISQAESSLGINEVSIWTDSKLPQLEVLLNARKMSPQLAQALGDDELIVENVDLVRHKPGRRAIMRFDLSDSTRIYGKTFASKRGPKVFSVTRKISRAHAFGPDVVTPDALAYVPEQKVVLLSQTAGESIETRLCSGDTELAERIAFALFHLHTSAVDLGRWHDMDQEFAPLQGRYEDVKSVAPNLAGAAEEVFQRIMHFDHHQMSWRFQPIHRDMYHDQIMIGKEQLVILDLDDATMSEPAVDVANFAAHLLLLGLQREHNSDAYRPVVDAFLRQYSELDHDLDQALVDYLIAATALRLAGIHVSRDNGRAVAKGLLELANSYLRNAWQAAA